MWKGSPELLTIENVTSVVVLGTKTSPSPSGVSWIVIVALWTWLAVAGITTNTKSKNRPTVFFRPTSSFLMGIPPGDFPYIKKAKKLISKFEKIS